MIMNQFKVFYLDDEKDDLIQPIKKKLELNDILHIELAKPLNFENELDHLTEILCGFDALILDLQLNGPQENGSTEKAEKFQVRYQAPPLAQTIRTLDSALRLDRFSFVKSSNMSMTISFHQRPQLSWKIPQY